MKAISIHTLYASAITCSLKFVELRSWRTSYRGDILICSAKTDSKNKDFKDSFIFGKALAVAEIVDCVKYTDDLREISFLDDDDNYDYTNMYAFLLDNIRPLKPFDVKGQQRIFNTSIKKEDLSFIKMTKGQLEPYKVEDYWIKNKFIKEKPFNFEASSYSLQTF